MLILTRRVGESIIIGDDIVITVLGVKGNNVSIGIDAPKNIWQDQSGQDRYTTEVVINPFGGTLQMLGSRENSADDREHSPQNSLSRQQNKNAPAPQPKAPPMDFEDDIPW